MKFILPPTLYRWSASVLAGLSLLAVAGTAAGDVSLSAVSSAGSVALTPGTSFTVTLTWAGAPAIAATDYAVTLNTKQLVFTGATFSGPLPPYADSLYRSAPVATDRVDLSWYKPGGFLGSDVTLQFTVPEGYSGPAVVAFGLELRGVQDATAAKIASTATGTTVNVATLSTVSTASSTGLAPRVDNWVAGASALSWSAGVPGTGSTADQAALNLSSSSTAGDLGVDCNQNLTLNKLSLNMAGTVNFRLGVGTRRTVTWVARGTDTAVLEFVRVSGVPLRNSIASNSVLATDLLARFAHQGSKDSNFGGLVSGSGKLTVDFYNSVNGATGGNLRIGTTGDGPSSHTGGTKLMMTTSDLSPASYRFIAAKSGAFGSGMLELNKARLDLNGFSQSVGGLGDGANGSSVTDLSTSTLNASTSLLTLDFHSALGIRTFAGEINNGTTRKIALTKTGSGTQVLRGVNTYTGATTVAAGKLSINGSLSAGSATTVATGALLGGSGTLNGSVNNLGTLTPGDDLGTLTTGGLTLAAASVVEIQIANWASNTPGSGWDRLLCGSLNIAASGSQPLVIKLAPLDLTGFDESAKALTIATSSAAITGFAPEAVAIDSSAMPGGGTWTVELDSTMRNLLLVYTPAPAPMALMAFGAATEEPIGETGQTTVTADTSLGLLGFSGLPTSAGTVVAEARITPSPTAGEAIKNLILTIVVRRGAEFASSTGAQVSAEIDKVIYRVEASADQLTWESAVNDLGASNTPPPGSSLPNLGDSEWEYHSFSAFEGTQVQGVIRALLINP
jgi:autotransporter-associated beta strand protein